MDRDTELLYGIGLNVLCQNNPRRADRYMKLFDSAEAVFRARAADPRWLRLLGGVSREKALAVAERILENCREGGIGILLLDDALYPERLRNIPDPPRVLYFRGKMPEMNELLGVSIVGSRDATRDILRLTRRVAYDLAERGAVVISGMARGIDGAAHCGALDAGGTTIAVLAGGVDRIYPRENEELYHRILEHGAVISEYPPGVVGKPSYYEARNRIIAGLAFGVLIAEGREKSGTGITLRHAVDFGRDVFAFPGSPTLPQAALANNILHDGAVLTRSAADILEEYWQYETLLKNGCRLKTAPTTKRPDIPEPEQDGKAEKTEKTGKAGKAGTVREAAGKAPEAESAAKEKAVQPKINLELFSEPERMILECLCHSKEAVHIDEITAKSGLEPAKIGGILTLLEMKGVLRQHAGSRYTLAE